jgi:predicted O-methyltransferase YrrM
MNSSINIRSIVKGLIPRPVLRRVSALRASRRFYDFYFRPRTSSIFSVVLATGETHNFTYELTERNLLYLAETIACVTQKPSLEIEGYIEEARNDGELRNLTLEDKRSDLQCPFGRRLGWYAIARATRPRVIVETGVERGHGALILCAALLRNANNGKPGRYYGTDINPAAGRLLTGKYAEVGKILYGDSIESLRRLGETIDLFINDSDHSVDYEFAEYLTIADKLSPGALVLGDNAHVTDKLAQFSRLHGRRFLFFQEDPKNHWYPGGGIGISFR